jgi:hypothetical protein
LEVSGVPSEDELPPHPEKAASEPMSPRNIALRIPVSTVNKYHPPFWGEGKQPTCQNRTPIFPDGYAIIAQLEIPIMK